MSRKCRIDLFLISPFLLQFVIDVDHHFSDNFSDHHLISLNLQATKKSKGTRGYWKLNNTLLKDTALIENIKSLAKDIFARKDLGHGSRWEFFKYKVRVLAIKRAKELMHLKNLREKEMMSKLDSFLKKDNLSEEEESIQVFTTRIRTALHGSGKGCLCKVKS